MILKEQEMVEKCCLETEDVSERLDAKTAELAVKANAKTLKDMDFHHVEFPCREVQPNAIGRHLKDWCPSTGISKVYDWTRTEKARFELPSIMEPADKTGSDLALVKDLEKSASAVYLACHEDVAKDISEKLKAAANRIKELCNLGG